MQIVGKQHNNFGCDAVSGNEACEISEKKSDVRFCVYFSTSKPEFFFFFFFEKLNKLSFY